MLLKTPDNFSFRATVYSHGWCELKPFEIDIEAWRLSCVIRGEDRTPRYIKLSETLNGISIDGPTDQVVEEGVKHVLRLDEDLEEFYTLLERYEALSWVRSKRAGRLLRSPTVFEDL